MDTLPDIALLRKAHGEAVYFGGRRIGTSVRSLRAAIFPVAWSRHYFRRLSAWTLDRAVVEDIARVGIKWVVFDDSELAQAWAAQSDDFLRCSEATVNRSGLKAALHRRYWVELGRASLLVPPSPGQLNLFAGESVKP